MIARDVIAATLPADMHDPWTWADAILAALADDGWRVVRTVPCRWCQENLGCDKCTHVIGEAT